MGNPETTKDAKALLADLDESGGNVSELARRYNRNMTTVYRWVTNAKRIVNKDYKPRYRTKKRADRLNMLVEYMGGRCQMCQKSYPPTCYDFHHLDPAQKDFGISQILLKDWDLIIKEADKCALLCANCHRTAHYVFNNLFKTHPGGNNDRRK